MTRALALQLCRKEFPQRQEVVKEVKYLLREKKCIAHVDRYTGRLRERAAPLVFVTYMGHFFQVSFGPSF